MKVVSTNIGKSRTVQWRKEEITTGIFKYPTVEGIQLGKEDVHGDKVIDRKYHGGIDKACYIFSADVYPDWQSLYSQLEWSYGMFGENLTIEGLDETQVYIGDIYQLGTAKVQVSEPRQPCKVLNVRFNSNDVVKRFVSKQRSGCYLRVLEEGTVSSGDEMILLERNPKSITVFDVFQMIYDKSVSIEKVDLAIEDDALAEATKEKLKTLWKV